MHQALIQHMTTEAHQVAGPGELKMLSSWWCKFLSCSFCSWVAICEFSVSALPTFSAQAWRTKQHHWLHWWWWHLSCKYLLVPTESQVALYSRPNRKRPLLQEQTIKSTRKSFLMVSHIASNCWLTTVTGSLYHYWLVPKSGPVPGLVLWLVSWISRPQVLHSGKTETGIGLGFNILFIFLGTLGHFRWQSKVFWHDIKSSKHMELWGVIGNMKNQLFGSFSKKMFLQS
jgi:hypothetical protein